MPQFQNGTAKADLPLLRSELTRTLNIQTKLFTQYQLGLVTDALFNSTNANIQDRINELSEEIVQGEAGLADVLAQQRFEEWQRRFIGVDLGELELDDRRALLSGLIERVTVRYLPEVNAHELTVQYRFGLDSVGGKINPTLRLPVTEA